MRDQEILARATAMPDDERFGALHEAGERRTAFSQHNIGCGVDALALEGIGHGFAGEYMDVISGQTMPCGTLGCTDTRPAVYPESERLYYCTSGAE